MFTYSQVEKLVSAANRSALSKPAVFEEMEAAAAIIVADAAGVDAAAAPEDWMKIPFVWVLDYIASAQTSNPSTELTSELKAKYDRAITMLTKRAVSTPGVSASVGQIESPYDLDY